MLARSISPADRDRGNAERGAKVGNHLRPAMDHSAVESQQLKSTEMLDHGEEETVYPARK